MSKAGWKWTIAKCLLAMIGGPLLGGILGFILGLILSLIFELATGVLIDAVHDAPGGGLLLILILGLCILIGTAIGFCFAAEFIQNDIEDNRVFNTRRLLLRVLFGLASLIGPLWIFLCWPPTKHRAPYQSHSVVLLVYAISICFLLAALRISFSSAKRSTVVEPDHTSISKTD
jgi:MFS family permease